MGATRIIVGLGIIAGATYNLFSMVGAEALGQYVLYLTGCGLVIWGANSNKQEK